MYRGGLIELTQKIADARVRAAGLGRIERQLGDIADQEKYLGQRLEELNRDLGQQQDVLKELEEDTVENWLRRVIGRLDATKNKEQEKLAGASIELALCRAETALAQTTRDSLVDERNQLLEKKKELDRLLAQRRQWLAARDGMEPTLIDESELTGRGKPLHVEIDEAIEHGERARALVQQLVSNTDAWLEKAPSAAAAFLLDPQVPALLLRFLRENEDAIAQHQNRQRRPIIDDYIRLTRAESVAKLDEALDERLGALYSLRVLD